MSQVWRLEKKGLIGAERGGGGFEAYACIIPTLGSALKLANWNLLKYW